MYDFRQLAGSATAATLLALTGCEEKTAAGPKLVYSGPLTETTNVKTLYSDSAKLKFQLTAPLQQQFENGDVVYPKGVQVTFYSADGKRSVVNTLTAKYGKVDKATNTYTMRGQVEVVNVPQAQRLDTEELFYDQSKQLIYTDSATYVKVTTPTELLTGYGLTANETFSRYSILDPKGVFAAPATPAAPAPQPLK